MNKNQFYDELYMKTAELLIMSPDSTIWTTYIKLETYSHCPTYDFDVVKLLSSL